MSVKRFVMSSNEKFAVLIDGNNFPMTYPNFYSEPYRVCRRLFYLS